MKARIFLFHRVNDRQDPLWPPMTTSRFREIIGYIVRTYSVVGLQEIHQALNGEKVHVHKPLAAITFDDGFKDNLENAAPILNHYGVTAAFFIVTGSMDLGKPTWTYTIDQLLSGTRLKTLALESLAIPSLQSVAIDSLRKKAHYSSLLKSYLKRMDDTCRQTVLEELSFRIDDVSVENPMMDWNEVRSLTSNGFLIGSHTVNHTPLATIKEKDDIRFEMMQSQKRIIEETGIAPLAIAYPIGSYDNRTIDIAKEVGYKIGLAVDHGIADLLHANRYALPRLELYQESKLKTFLRMHGIQQRIKNLLG